LLKCVQVAMYGVERTVVLRFAAGTHYKHNATRMLHSICSKGAPATMADYERESSYMLIEPWASVPPCSATVTKQRLLLSENMHVPILPQQCHTCIHGMITCTK
jgi:hypothetical protein